MTTKSTMNNSKRHHLVRRWLVNQTQIALSLLSATIVLGGPFQATAQTVIWDDLTLVQSNANTPLEDNTVILISTEAIHVDLDTAVELIDGHVQDTALFSRSHPYISELQEIVEDALESRLYWEVVRGDSDRVRSATVVADGRTTYRLLADVMLLASAAGVQQFYLATRHASFDELWSHTDVPEPGDLRLLTLYYPQTVEITPPPASHFNNELDAMFDLVSPGEPYVVGPSAADEDDVEDPPESDTGEYDSILPDHDGPLIEELQVYEYHPPPVPLPQLVISISEDGFRLSDFGNLSVFNYTNLATPFDTCGSAPETPTICIPDERADEPQLIDRLDFRGLYNRLVEVVDYSIWSDVWPDESRQIMVVADEEIPLDVVIRTIDVARFRLEQDSYDGDESFTSSAPRSPEVELFGQPCLLLPRTAE